MTGRVLALCALIVSLALPAAARADVVPVASGSASSITGPAAFSFAVPAGTDRFLAVGISTASNVTVASVNFGAQVLTRQQQTTSGAVRSEIWSLTAPNPGTANVIVTLSGPAPVIAGATSFAGVDQFNPIIAGSSGGVDNQITNSANFVTNGTVAKDGMFGTIVVSPAAQTGDITTQGSVDLVVADNRWATSVGTIRGAGSTRVGWTGANMSQNSGIAWRWTNQGVVSPYAFTWLALKSTTGNTPPAVNTPTATNITQTSATLGGILGSTGGQSITAKGVVYCQAPCTDPVIGGAGVSQLNAATNDTTGPFTVNAGGLTAGRTYTYKAFASNALGTSYTSAATFNTLNTAPTAEAGGPYSVGEDGSVTLNGSGADANGDTLTYTWDLDGDGTTDLTGATPSLTRAAREAAGINDGPRAYTITLRVSDGKDTTTDTATLNVNNTVPDATVSNNGPVNERSTATVSFSNVVDPSTADTAAGFRYAYDFDNAGTYEIGGATYATAVTASSATVPASFLADGPASRTVRMLVIDKDGVGHLYTTSITVDNVAPTGALANQTVEEGTNVSVGLTNVADAGGDAVRYVYDLDGDGADDTAGVTYANASAAATETTPAGDGLAVPAARTVRVRVIDEDGASTVYTATITVTNVKPTAKLAAATVDEGTIATVGPTDAADAGGDEIRYVYDLDGDATDDTANVTFGQASGATTASVPGNLTADGPATVNVRVRVIDKDGDSNVYTADVDVDNVDPTATLADVTTEEGTPATVAFTGADDVSAADKAAGFTFEWDADGDGTFTPGTGSITVPAPDGPATRSITGAIIDRDGGRSEYTATLTVTNGAPKATITGPDAVPSSGATTLTLALSDAGDDTLTSALDWGDGTVDAVAGSGAKTVTHTYTSPGEKTITLVATDSDGAKSAAATHTLTVAAAPAAPAPPTTTPVTPVEVKQKITGVKVTPRCLRADDLRARIAAVKTMKVRFSLATGAPVKFTLRRLTGKGGASKCPPARGVKHPDGKRVPGVYRPFTNKSVAVKKGANTVTVAATGRKGKRLAPGTYLLVIDSGGVRARTKLWVLAP
jgi:hypothetical protein